jgi:flagellar assembly factor FliW
MIVSTPDVKQFLIELIEHANYPGKLLEFVVAVKKEIQNCTVEQEAPVITEEMLNTASGVMDSRRAQY